MSRRDQLLDGGLVGAGRKQQTASRRHARDCLRGHARVARADERAERGDERHLQDHAQRHAEHARTSAADEAL